MKSETRSISESSASNGLSPLDQIRLVEAETTRRIIAARELSEQRAAEARAHAAALKKQAKEKGEREGQIRYKEIIAKAEEQSQMMITQAQHEADHLRRKGESRMEQAVREALEIVLGLKRKSDEP